MQPYDLTPINDELKRAVKQEANNLETEVTNLITRFAEYQDEVLKMSNLTKLTEVEIKRLEESVNHFTKAFDLVKEILNSGGSAEDKIAMLKKVVE